MIEYEKKLSFYYDDIYEDKKYDEEVQFILDKCKNIEPKNILDVGCGTGEHIKHLASNLKDIERIFGVDISPHMINIANQKQIDNTEFYCKNLQEFDFQNFDLITSMFNVVNHILSVEELESFFREIKKRLAKNGIFIFDCWNGVAFNKDIPKYTKKIKNNKKYDKIIIESVPETNLFESTVKMNNKIIIQSEDEIIDSFEYSLTHILWMPKTIIDLLNKNSLAIESINAGFDKNKLASEEDFKITFVVKNVE